MFWNKIAWVYDLFENIYNRKVFSEIGHRVASYIEPADQVLECACGTGAISVAVAAKAAHLTATDYAEGMLKQARKKLSAFGNVTVETADITALSYPDHAFDKVVAGNVIHLLPDPKAAMAELVRVCRPGGMLIIPTYINDSKEQSRLAVRFLEKLGASFKRQFDKASYEAFFADLGFADVRYDVVDGRMPCDIAVIRIAD